MLHRSAAATIVSVVMLLGTPAFADVIYNNLTPNNLMATAVRPDTAPFEIEAGDDFFLSTRATINSASFDGLLVPGSAGGTPTISQVVVEIYRVFPNDSNVGRTSGPPTFSTPAVPTRVNSPSDVAFDSRDSAAGQLTFSSPPTLLSATFTALNSVQPGGIHPIPNQATGGNGPVTGQEVQIDVSFATPFSLPPDHYFFVPQVLLSNGGQFFWLSASRPISGAGTTPFPAGVTDLQMWTRDAMLDPDWLRVGTDIVDMINVPTTPTFNGAFSLEGTVPEPSTVVFVGFGLVGFAAHVARRRRAAK
jgi:PEP-CTERM motif